MLDLADEQLSQRRFVGEDLDGSRLTDCVFVDCDLSAASMREASLRGVEFRDCRMSAVNLSGAELKDVRFVDCKLDDANFRMAKGRNVVFDGSVLIGADFYAAALPAAAFAGCDLSSTEFSKCDAAGADLRGSRLDGISGAIALAGVTIDSAQMIPLALSVFAALGITIDDDVDQLSSR